MEGMDADYYVLECLIRDRLNGARRRAQVAALLADANRRQGPSTVTTRVIDRGRELVNHVWRVVGEIARAMPGGHGLRSIRSQRHTRSVT
jgi:hypothetical protein